MLSPLPMAITVRGPRQRPLVGPSADVSRCVGVDESLHGVLEEQWDITAQS